MAGLCRLIASSGEDGVFLRRLAANKQRSSQRRGTTSTRVDRAGSQLAFVSDKDEYGQDKAKYTLYYATVRAPNAVAVTRTLDGMTPSDRGNVSFARSGSAIIFGVAPAPADSIPADSLADKAVFDLWHWKDPACNHSSCASFRATARARGPALPHPSKSAVRLANDSLPSVTLSDDARTALAVTKCRTRWRRCGRRRLRRRADRRCLAANARESLRSSPSGVALAGAKYVHVVEDGRWHSYACDDGEIAALTGAIAGVRFDERSGIRRQHLRRTARRLRRATTACVGVHALRRGS